MENNIENTARIEKKKGLLIYDTIYGSTSEVAYWLKALIGDECHLEVKKQGQVITLDPFDFVIIGSYTRREKPSKATDAFIKKHRGALARKQVAYFLTCGDSDETQILNVPGTPPHLIGGRNYFADIFEKYPDVVPKVIGAFGGRQVYSALHTIDRLTVDLVGKLAKESEAPWTGRDIWESLVPERVEVFAREIREAILGLPHLQKDAGTYRGFWQSLQPATVSDPYISKVNSKPHIELLSSKRIYYSRFSFPGNFELADKLLYQWADRTGLALNRQRKTFFNCYYHASRKYDKNKLVIHVTMAEMPEDPDNVHAAFRCYAKPNARKGAETDIVAAKKLMRA